MKIGRGWWFVIVVLPVSWIVQYVLFSGMLPKVFPGLYMFVPAIVAFIFFLFSKHPVKNQTVLFTRRTGLWPWIFAIVYPVLLFGLVALLAVVTGLGSFDTAFAAKIFTPTFILSILTITFFMLISVFGEEYGWRGYLLPALTEKYSRIWATIITGLVWGVWHIPSYYLIYREAGLGNPVFLTLVGVVTVAVGAFPYSYLFYRNGNILPAVLMHAVYDVMGLNVILGTPAIAGISEAVPGLVTMHQWLYALGLIFATGLVAAVVFARKFANLKGY
jgi:uncharacterized protein